MAADAFLHIQNILLGSHQLFIYGVMPVDILILCQISDIFVFGQDDSTGIGGYLMHDDTKQRGFSCSVIADQGSLFPFLYVKRSIPENYLFSK